MLACRSFRCPERQALGRRSASPDEYDELEVRGALALRGTRQPEASPGGYRFYVARQPLRCRSGSKSVAVRNSAKHQRASFRPKADSLLSHSITYRIALGPRAGQKAFTLRSLPGNPLPAPSKPFLASADGFSLHAEDALPGRHHPRGLRAAGLHRAAGGPGAATAGAPDEIPRGVRAAQPVPLGRRAGVDRRGRFDAPPRWRDLGPPPAIRHGTLTIHAYDEEKFRFKFVCLIPFKGGV